ncbi:MAG TPA: 3-hydroxyacyl-CoA dehydrogenase NAD-binding domain-containing protein [Longimicrobiales bacterium]|nr:3-hydroxyacyl-CoA dehydrogenase NAD-binding domain-containing protein [Longimicrobiales bacterium]
MSEPFKGITSDIDAITLTVDAQAVAWVTIDRPGAKVNVLGSGVLKRLDEVIGAILDQAASGRVRSAVIRSGKPATFIAGADVNEISAIRDPAEGAAKARAGQQIFARLAALPVPTVAVIDGVCLGGGTELILACTYRIASDRRETRIGLPEVQLGILPGFGGTTRLPRLVGMRAALDIILTGRPVDARKAERIGLVDERVHPAILDQRAAEVARSIQGKRSGPRRNRNGLTARLLESGPGRKFMLTQARKRVLAETHGHYPAPLAALDLLGRTLSISVEQSLGLEAEAIGRLIVTPVSKNLIHVYHLNEAAKKAAPAVTPHPVDRVAVIGAGVMGGGIAQILAYRGVTVRLKDIRHDAIGLGLRHAWQAFDSMVRKRRLEARAAKQMMDRIAPTLDYSGFAQTDLVIEAVIEKLDVKKAVLRDTENAVPRGCVLTTNTSSLSVNEMQNVLDRPQDFCGMHFFNPVHRMPLVEIIRGDHTGPEAIATVYALARKLEKTPIVVRDGPGFLVNRILAPYLNEAGWLLAEGGRIEQIDRALVQFGMPMGPLRLLDEIGLDVARHAAGVMFDAFGERLRPAAPLVALGSSNRLGRKSGRGFYRYEGGREQDVDQSIYAELGATTPRHALDERVIVERCVYAMVNEAARILADGIVAGPGDVDLGMIMGTGFPPFRGGLLRYADAVGLAVIAHRLEQLTRELGPRFEPASLLRARASAGRGFYG